MYTPQKIKGVDKVTIKIHRIVGSEQEKNSHYKKNTSSFNFNGKGRGKIVYLICVGFVSCVWDRENIILFHMWKLILQISFREC